MKSKVEVLRSLIGNNTVVINGVDGGYVVKTGNDPATSATSTIDEVSEEMIHAITPRYANLHRWIAIDWIAEIQIKP